MNALNRTIKNNVQRERIDKREQGKLLTKSANNIGAWITSQNVKECLQKADIYINNVECDKSFDRLKYELVKFITLVNNPGTIPPTHAERTMQLASTARLMSGCISRQVGAVVVDREGYAIGLGWNDPPGGQTPCSLRFAKDLLDAPDDKVFSEYEQKPEFTKFIRQYCSREDPFCFREQYAKLQKDQDGYKEYTRALHAEENALFQAVRNRGDYLEGAELYCTASPCTLCAKKAYQLRIKKIIYIDEYPGPAIDQTIKTGSHRIEVQKYTGVVGAAYFKLYSSLIPEKDLNQIRLFSQNKLSEASAQIHMMPNLVETSEPPKAETEADS